jgi:predicted nucleic acid-binding protein
MTTYILDTDIISYLWDAKSPYHQKIVDKLNTLNDDDIVGLSIVSIYELTYGVNSFKDENLKSTFQNALSMIKKDKDIFIYSLDVDSADFFSKIKCLYKSNTGIDSKNAKKNDLDFMIASVSMSQKAILVSNDKLFETLSKHTNLKYENWVN